MENLTLNVYDHDGVMVEKMFTAKKIDLMFGTIRKLMELLKIEELDSSVEMMKTIYSAWDDIKGVLGAAFPDVTDEDWDHVKIKELLPIIVGIAKYSVSEITKIPIDPN